MYDSYELVRKRFLKIIKRMEEKKEENFSTADTIRALSEKIHQEMQLMSGWTVKMDTLQFQMRQISLLTRL